MQVIKRITCAALACAMLLGNTAYAADYEETSAPFPMPPKPSATMANTVLSF